MCWSGTQASPEDLETKAKITGITIQEKGRGAVTDHSFLVQKSPIPCLVLDRPAKESMSQISKRQGFQGILRSPWESESLRERLWRT
jgi:hypothetical protein